MNFSSRLPLTLATDEFGVRSARVRIVWMLLPAMFVVLGLFAGGLLLALIQSLGYFPPIGEHTLTLKHYLSLWRDQEVTRSLGLTLLLSSVATFISAALGLLLALSLRKFIRGRRALSLLLQLPIAIPHLVAAIIMIDILSPSGLLSRLVFSLGLIQGPSGFPSLISDRYGIGIVLAYVLKETPFIALITLAVLVRVGNEFETVARTLGASAWQRFWHITLPMAAPAVVSASLVVFAFIFSAFEVPFVLGRPYPAMLPVIAQRKFMETDLAQRPEAIAIAMATAAIAMLLVWIYMRIAQVFIGVERPTIF